MTSKIILILSLLSAVFFYAVSSWAADGGEGVAFKTSVGDTAEVTITVCHASYALVIGNSAYHNGWDSLPSAVQDVRDVAEALEYNGFDVTLKTDLTKKAFEETVRGFWHKYGHNPGHRLLFYFAGHGYTREMVTGEELGYFVMIDAPLPASDPLGFDLRSVDLLSFITQAKLIKARQVLFIFDSFFSGSVLDLKDIIVLGTITDEVRRPVRQFIIAGRSGELAPDSLFKQAFLDLIEGRGEEPFPDGFITGAELGFYLRNKVTEYNPSQQLQYGTVGDSLLDKGDFVFLVKKPPEKPLAAEEEEERPPGVEDTVSHEAEPPSPSPPQRPEEEPTTAEVGEGSPPVEDTASHGTEPPPPPPPGASDEPSTAEDEESPPKVEDRELEMSEPPPPPQEVMVPFDSVEIKPEVIHHVAPNYPEIARKAGVEGEVILEITIDEEGNVVAAEVMKEPGNVGLGEAAIAAVMQWKFKPAYQRDKPVKVKMSQAIHFKLK